MSSILKTLDLFNAKSSREEIAMERVWSVAYFIVVSFMFVVYLIALVFIDLTRAGYTAFAALGALIYLAAIRPDKMQR